MSKEKNQICELAKNSPEGIRFQLGEIERHKFVDFRLFVREDSQDPIPTKRGVTVPIHLWPLFREAISQVDRALIKEGWLERERVAAIKEKIVSLLTDPKVGMLD